jgi:uncharacterized protein (DUF2141 family)
MLITAFCLYFPAHAADMTVTIEGVQSAKGQLIVCLWVSKKGFPLCPKDAPNRHALAATDGAAVTFKGLAPGIYAVSAFHDTDGNGKLKQNFIGIPKEPATVSGPKQKRMGPPKFDGAAIVVDGDMAVTLTFE